MLFTFKEQTQKLKPIPDEKLSKIYMQTMNEINDFYIQGTIKFIEKCHADLDAKINESDKKVNVIWKRCNRGDAAMQDFRMALEDYKNLYLQGVELFKKKGKNPNLILTAN